jgi:hypothetical protein
MPGMSGKTNLSRQPPDYMSATLEDMRLPRGRLLIVENGKEIEITKKENDNDDKA